MTAASRVATSASRCGRRAIHAVTSVSMVTTFFIEPPTRILPARALVDAIARTASLLSTIFWITSGAVPV